MSKSSAFGRFGRALALLALLPLLSRCGARSALEPGEVVRSCKGLSVESVRFGTVEQMDLLFMIDNSRSMADKQALLRDAIPPLVRRLGNPHCASVADRTRTVVASSPGAPCPDGFVREFEPVKDLHIGVITSSIGSVGGLSCAMSEAENDLGRLLGSRPRAAGVPSYRGQGFLSWDPEQRSFPPGESVIETLERDFASLVTLAGENGCGFEASLESWYRFLIDPAPPASYVVRENETIKEGIDQVLLTQRAQFLRPDSAVAVVMLSDENDCSIAATKQSWVVGTSSLGGGLFQLPRGTSACASDPNSPCCRPCNVGLRPAPGCPSDDRDPECSRPHNDDVINSRCFEQKRRFGFDMLYPTARYAVGLKSRTLCPNSIYQDADCNCSFARERASRLGLPEPACGPRETGNPVRNPLYSNLSGGLAFDRDPSQVILAGIVGVPWQDIATPETLTDPTRLEYLNAVQLAERDPVLGFDRWQLILGDPVMNTPAADPFMRESIAPRSGINPLTQDAIVGSNSTNPRANAINGHEHQNGVGDLQYACTFELDEPRDCGSNPNDPTCDCNAGAAFASPLCQDPATQLSSKTQFFAKAYPGLRELDVLRRVGSSAVVASICPKPLRGGPSDELEFGYRPAVAGIVSRLRCATLDAEFNQDTTSPDFGTVNCRLVSLREGVSSCDCSGANRRPLGKDDALALQLKLESAGVCGKTTGTSCGSFCGCEIPQSRGTALQACQNDSEQAPLDPATSQPVDGWCYLDPAAGFGSSQLVQACPAGNPRDLRLLGAAVPAPGERLMAICGHGCDGATE